MTELEDLLQTLRILAYFVSACWFGHTIAEALDAIFYPENKND